jgi:hypothetical protein
MINKINNKEVNEMIKSFSNTEYGLESAIYKIDKGFSVSMKDVDSGEILPTITIFKTIEDAELYAKKIIN